MNRIAWHPESGMNTAIFYNAHIRNIYAKSINPSGVNICVVWVNPSCSNTIIIWRLF